MRRIVEKTKHKWYLREIAAIICVLIALNVFQLALTRYIGTGEVGFNLGASKDDLTLGLFMIFGLLFGMVTSLLFIRYQNVKSRGIAMELIAKTELEKAYNHLRELDSLKSKFITVASHQLRTPLNSIRWTLETMLGGDVGKLKKEQEQFLRLAHASDRFIISVIDDLLVAMDVEGGHFRPDIAPLSIDGIVGSVVKEYAHDARVKKIHLEFEPAGGPPREVDGDAAKLMQAVSKIVDNAIRYTPDEGRIVVAVTYGDDAAYVAVRDSGIGIPASDLKHVGERFFRSPLAINVAPDASGLGLYIAKNIIEAHHGVLDVQSKEGVGTEVTIRLPLVAYR